MRTDILYGDRLISVRTPAKPDGTYDDWHVGVNAREITVGRIPGLHGDLLTAQVAFENGRPDIIIPLHRAERFEVQYGD